MDPLKYLEMITEMTGMKDILFGLLILIVFFLIPFVFFFRGLTRLLFQKQSFSELKGSLFIWGGWILLVLIGVLVYSVDSQIRFPIDQTISKAEQSLNSAKERMALVAQKHLHAFIEDQQYLSKDPNFITSRSRDAGPVLMSIVNWELPDGKKILGTKNIVDEKLLMDLKSSVWFKLPTNRVLALDASWLVALGTFDSWNLLKRENYPGQIQQSDRKTEFLMISPDFLQLIAWAKIRLIKAKGNPKELQLAVREVSNLADIFISSNYIVGLAAGAEIKKMLIAQPILSGGLANRPSEESIGRFQRTIFTYQYFLTRANDSSNQSGILRQAPVGLCAAYREEFLLRQQAYSVGNDLLVKWRSLVSQNRLSELTALSNLIGSNCFHIEAELQALPIPEQNNLLDSLEHSPGWKQRLVRYVINVDKLYRLIQDIVYFHGVEKRGATVFEKFDRKVESERGPEKSN